MHTLAFFALVVPLVGLMVYDIFQTEKEVRTTGKSALTDSTPPPTEPSAS